MCTNQKHNNHKKTEKLCLVMFHGGKINKSPNKLCYFHGKNVVTFKQCVQNCQMTPTLHNEC